MKAWFASFCFAAVLASSHSFAADEMVLRERCHKGECGFMKIVGNRIIAGNGDGKLHEVKSRSVILPMKAGEPDKIPEPGSFGLVRVTYAFCSTQKPAIVFNDGKRFYAHVLNVGETPAGFAVDSHIEYWAVCHDRVVSVSDVMDGKLAKDAADLGYHKVPEAEPGQFRFRTKKKALRFLGL